MDRRQVILATRLRPFTPREISHGAKSCVVIDGACTTLINPDSGNARAFVLDHSYDSSDVNDTRGNYASNLTLFKDLGLPMLSKVLDGVNTSLFAYGHVGSGKTHTLIGQENDPGLLPRMLEALFQHEHVRTQKIIVQASFCEILNDQIRDVLEQNFYSPGGLKIRASETGGSIVEGLSKITLSSMVDCEELLAKILRSLGVLALGAHTVFTVELRRTDSSSSRRGAAVSKLHVVELAGSAAAADPLALSGKGRPTPQDKSLLAWANVMSALAENQLYALQSRHAPGVRPKQVHVPFRGSSLTRILEDSMGAGAHCVVIATLSPSHMAYKETLNTFRLVVRMKEVKKVARNDALLSEGLADPDLIPAAGGGWRWAYCARMGEPGGPGLPGSAPAALVGQSATPRMEAGAGAGAGPTAGAEAARGAVAGSTSDTSRTEGGGSVRV